MPTKREVWLAADSLREKSESVSVRSVRAALPYGGSYRDIGPHLASLGPHLASWKAERAYTRVIELSGLPEQIQTQLARVGAGLWEAALKDATMFLSAERGQARAVAKVDQDIRNEALAAADVLEARVEHLQAEMERLKSDLKESRAQAQAFLSKLMDRRSNPPDPDGVRKAERRRSREFWNDLVTRIRDMLRELPPESPGMTCEQLLEWMPQDLRERASAEGEIIDRSTLLKRLYERVLREKYVKKVGDLYLALN